MTTFEDAKVGDKVWDLFHNRWSTIGAIVEEDNFPIKTEITSYTMKGSTIKNGGRTLFWDEVIITPPEKPLPKLEVDTKVLVWDNSNCIKRKGHFSHFDEKGKMHVFASGTTSWSHKEIVPYNYWKLAKD